MVFLHREHLWFSKSLCKPTTIGPDTGCQLSPTTQAGPQGSLTVSTLSRSARSAWSALSLRQPVSGRPVFFLHLVGQPDLTMARHIPRLRPTVTIAHRERHFPPRLYPFNRSSLTRSSAGSGDL